MGVVKILGHPKRGRKTKGRTNPRKGLNEKIRIVKVIIIEVIKVRVPINLNPVIIMVQLGLMDHTIGKVSTALILGLVIRRTIMMIVVPVVIKVDITIMVLTNS